MNNKRRNRWVSRMKMFVSCAGGAALAILVYSQQDPEDAKSGIDQYTGIIIKIGAALSGFIAGGIGGWVPITTALAMIMAMDYVSGFIVGLSGKSKKTPNGKLSSHVGFVGLMKKAMMLAVVAIAHMVDTGIGMGTNTFRDLACGWYIGNEGLSIYENMRDLGVPFPPPLKKALDKIKKTGELPKPSEDKESEDDNG